MIAQRIDVRRRQRDRVRDRPMKSAVIVVDMLNPYDHPDAELLMESVRETLPGMCDLVARARDSDVPVIYVNDNHENWSAGRPELVERALRGHAPELVEPIVPSPDLAFVVKARHPIFSSQSRSRAMRSRRSTAISPTPRFG
jgi:nicotinamidase-related amidase